MSTGSRFSTPRPRRFARSCNGATHGLTKHDLSSLRLLGSVGEPINPEAWMWYHKHDRRRALPNRRHVVADRDRRDHDHAASRRHRLRSPARARCRSSAWMPRSSMSMAMKSPKRRRQARPTQPWPSMLRSSTATRIVTKNNIGAKSRAVISRATARAATRMVISGSWAASTMCSTFPVTASAPAEVESALVSHPTVAEAAVVGRPDEIKGQGGRRVCDPEERRYSQPQPAR